MPNAGIDSDNPVGQRYKEAKMLLDYGYTELGVDAVATSWCNETNAAIDYVGGWQTQGYYGTRNSSNRHINGYSKYGWQSTDSATLNFVGRGVEWFAYRSPAQGKADVYIDDTFIERVDLYSPTTITSTKDNPVFSKQDLVEGVHTLRIDVVSEVPGGAVDGNWVHVDGFRVTGGLDFDDEDIIPPIITNIDSGTPGTTTATITWTTDEPSTSQVEYGLTTDYGSTTAEDTNLTTNHSVVLTDLNENTTYHFRVISVDVSENIAVSNDGTFITEEIVVVPDTYVLSFDSQGGSVVADIIDLEEFDTVALSETPVRNGFLFKHWNTQADGSGASFASGGIFTMPGNQVTLYAIWKEVSESEEEKSGSNFSVGRSGGIRSGKVRDVTFIENEVVNEKQISQLEKRLIVLLTEYTELGGLLTPAMSKFIVNFETEDKYSMDGHCALYTFTRDLRFGDVGEDVRALQQSLNCLGFTLAADGPGASGQETIYFSVRTSAALISFQEYYMTDILVPVKENSGTGIFSTFSRMKMHELLTS